MMRPEAQLFDPYWVTKRIAVGPFPSRFRLEDYLNAGITHVLNVSERNSEFKITDGFREIVDRKIKDLEIIPPELIEACLTDMDRMLLCNSEAKLLVHCLAGQNRSPAIIWLYLISCGLAEATARDWLESRAMDAIGGHPRLVDAGSVAQAQRFGSQRTQIIPASLLAPPEFL